VSVSQVGAATGTTTCTVPAHNIGDLIVIFAYRSGSTTAPTLGAGFTNLRTQSGTTCSGRIGFRVATSTSDASGTWTNASHLTCLVYRSSNYSTGSSLYIGTTASTSSTTTTVNYPAITLKHTDTTSWVIGFAGTSVATAALSTHAPAGMTFFTNSDVTATTEVCAFDTNGAVASWSSTNTTVSAAGNSISATVELIENQPGAAINNFVQHHSYTYNNRNAIGELLDNLDYYIDPSLAGNGFVVTVAYPSGATPTISDDKGNTWPASGAAGTVTADNGAGNMALQSFVLTSATTGTSRIRVSFGGNPQSMVKTWITQLYNVTGTIEGSSTVVGAAVNTAGSIGIISPGSITPSTNNCLVLSYIASANGITGVTTNPALIVPETGYQLNDADISWGAGAVPNASQFALQTTATATVPRFYLNGSGTADQYNVVAFALSTGSQGTPKPSGPGAAPWIDRMIYFGTSGVTATMFLQLPATGNAMAILNNFQATGSPAWTAVTDNDGASWVRQNPVAGAPVAYTRVNSTARSSRTASITIGTPAGNFFGIYYDLSNCDTAPIVASAGVGATGVSNTNTVANQPSITPTGPNQLTLTYMGVGIGPCMGITSPGGVFDIPNGVESQLTASIAGTTLSVTATAWGSGVGTGNILYDAGGIQTPTNIIAGTTSQTTTSVQPSQTVASETMFSSISDVSNMSWGNCAGHYFNGASTATQNWTWGISNQPGNQVLSIGLIFKGPPAAGGPAKQYDWPNPQPVTWYQSWTDWHQQTPTVLNTFRQNDWPNPQPVQWYQSWTQNAIHVQPFHQYDWPNPQPATWYQHWQDSFTLTNPNRQLDWPNPQPVVWYQHWNDFPAIYFPAGQKPFFQTDWPLPKTYQPIDQFWSSNTNLLPIPTVLNTFRQSDWPNPQPVYWYQSWTEPGNVQLPFPTPFRQTDWPNPPPVQWYEDWYQALAPHLPTVFPFRQTDWPNPETWTPIDQWWFNNLINLLTATPPSLPHNQYDWPLPKVSQPIDPTWLQSLALLLPPPPPPSELVTGGRQVWPEELDDLTLATHKWHQRLIDHARNKTGEDIRKAAAELGRIGGLKGGPARAESLNAQQRSNIASRAANARWQPKR
jgi:hypothetical protein